MVPCLICNIRNNSPAQPEHTVLCISVGVEMGVLRPIRMIRRIVRHLPNELSG